MKRMGFILCAVLLAFSVSACRKSAPTWQEQYDLGVRYLSEDNYEEAIIAFTAAIEIDPEVEDAYISIAEAYQGQGDVDSAIEILRRGYEVTNSNRLQRMIQIYELNSEPAAELKNISAGLFSSMKNRNRDTMADYLESWLAYHGWWGMDKDGSGPIYKYDDVGFNGESFCEITNGTCLLINEPSQFYFGEVSEGIPNGAGCMVVIQTYYPDEWYDGCGGVEYYLLDGYWENGQSVGNGTVRVDHSRRHDLANPREAFVFTVEAACVFGNNQLMETADVAVTLKTESGDHRFEYRVSDGILHPDEWNSEDGMMWCACAAHSDCGVSITLNDVLVYQNPYAWKSELREAHRGSSMFIQGSQYIPN